MTTNNTLTPPLEEAEADAITQDLKPDAASAAPPPKAAELAPTTTSTPPTAPVAAAEPEDTKEQATVQTQATPVEQVKRSNRALLIGTLSLVCIFVLCLVYALFMRPMTVGVVLRSNPPGAVVLVDGKTIGKSPTESKVSVGKHHIIFRLKGYHPVIEEVDVLQHGQVIERLLSPHLNK